MKVVGILHCHSIYSYDAKMSLCELKELFISKGIQFVCMTEHVDEMSRESAEAFVRECEALSDESFLFIPGFEVPYKSPSGEHAHVLMIGQRSFHDVYAPDIEVLRRWTNEASFVVLAHPVRNHFEVDDGLLGEVDGLEVWNQQYEGKRVPRVRSLHLFSELRNTKSNLIATGGVDFHRKEHFGAPTVTLDVAEFTEDTILEKLKNGAFTVSSPQVSFCGTLPNAEELASLYRWQSHLAVSIIVIGKTINAILASVGISLPKSLKQLIRKSL